MTWEFAQRLATTLGLLTLLHGAHVLLSHLDQENQFSCQLAHALWTPFWKKFTLNLEKHLQNAHMLPQFYFQQSNFNSELFFKVLRALQL